MENVIQIRGLKFAYLSTSTSILDIPEFFLRRGERFFLFGPSGSGKTTFLEMLAGILVPQSGSIEILGQPIHTMSGPERDRFRAHHIGYIFQSFNLIPYLTCEENIVLPFDLHPDLLKKTNLSAIKKQVSHLAERLGIDGILAKNVTELSVGQQQRVAVARALVTKPELIFADEPTSALDMDHREKFLQVMFDLCTEVGTTVVFVSHDRSIQTMFSRAQALGEISGVSK